MGGFSSMIFLWEVSNQYGSSTCNAATASSMIRMGGFSSHEFLMGGFSSAIFLWEVSECRDACCLGGTGQVPEAQVAPGPQWALPPLVRPLWPPLPAPPGCPGLPGLAHRLRLLLFPRLLVLRLLPATSPRVPPAPLGLAPPAGPAPHLQAVRTVPNQRAECQ